MRCSVPGCKNDSRYSSKSQGITFHVFPVEPALRASWLRALGKESWAPKERSAVCSEHFLCDDLYESKKGLRRKVRHGAVPIVVQVPEDCQYTASASLKVCRICLALNKKLFSIRKYKLKQAYDNLTGVTACEEDDRNLPQKLCAECAQRLVNSSQFRMKCLRSNSLLMEMIKQDALSIKTLKTINREDNQLSSPLQIKVFEPDHCDLVIDGDTELCKPEKDPSFTENQKTDVKNEDLDNEIFLDELDDGRVDSEAIDYNDDDNESYKVTKIQFNDLNTKADIKNEDDTDIFNNDYDDAKIASEILENNDKVDINDDDKDYVASESSTDDELPRNVLRSRLREKKSKKEKKEQKKGTKKRKETQKKDPTEPKIDRRRKPFFNDDLSETLFNITDLTFEEQVAEIDKRKESANYKNGVFKCDECYKGFLDEDAYNSHMSRHTNECGNHRCHICKTHFKHPHALRKHVTAHHTQRFSCKQCPYATTHRQSARLHERWHKGTKYTCPHCPDEFVKFTTYMGHIRIKHPSDFVCQLCGYSFVSEKGILLHKKLKHRKDVQIPKDGPYCELCDLRFIDSEALRRHMSVSGKHNTGDSDRRAANKPSKRKNKEIRERRLKEREEDVEDDRRVYPSQIKRAEGPIPCEQCGLQLEDSRAYHGHFRRMHPDKNRTNYPSMKSPCMCEVCGRMFQSYALLKDHRWVHTGERPFSCDSCGKSFRMKQRLVAHRRVHSAEKATYVCNLCGKHFSTHSNRQRHMFIHTGLKPFKCEMCGKGFKHASEKRAHVTYVHLKKPWPKRSRGKRRPDARQVPMPPPGTNELGMPPPWACDPKPPPIDKPPYYTLKM